MRTEGDKRLNNDAAAREARDARSRCEELSRILDHQTRITDALSHEMASIRGRVEIKDLRQDRKDRNVLLALFTGEFQDAIRVFGSCHRLKIFSRFSLDLTITIAVVFLAHTKTRVGSLYDFQYFPIWLKI